MSGLDLEFSNGDTNPVKTVTIAAGGNQSITATPSDNVAEVVVSPTPLEVSLTDGNSSNLKITVPEGTAPGFYTIYFEIFSDTGYRLLKSLEVTVTKP